MTLATKGISIENAMNTLSTLVGSTEISFIKYGINYVIVQASPEYRALQRIS
jgi:HAE1 family hydrophobic/amphiphilic exporter-1